MKRRTRKRVIRCLAVILCLLMLLPTLSYFIPSDTTVGSELPVVYVDGNTNVELSGDEIIPETAEGPYEVEGIEAGNRLRIAVKDDEFVYVDLLGIETEEVPEGADAGKQSAGSKAYDHANSLVKGKQVYLEQKKEAANGGLMEALVYLDDGTLLNEQMLKDGFAKVASAVSAELEESFAAAMQEAKKNKVGLWNDAWKETN